ncbi:MAG: 50S ribosomal protein L4 [Dethiobacter sp.]|jgi:large subunit ribosomal protein L4|nr:50S ribosomal protein L4 [Dethiobacter sp.]
MPSLTLYNRDGEQVGEIEVQTALFAAPIKKSALYQTTISQAARKRQGTSAVRDRSEVRGGGNKPWAQKGTGRARHGSTRSPIWVGGGSVFGPHPRDYGFTVPKKIRRAALRSALSAKVGLGMLLVVDDLGVQEPKTKSMIQLLNKLKVFKSALIITAEPNPNVIKSARNLPRIKTTIARQLNVLDILSYDYLIMTGEALGIVQEVFGE